MGPVKLEQKGRKILAAQELSNGGIRTWESLENLNLISCLLRVLALFGVLNPGRPFSVAL